MYVCVYIYREREKHIYIYIYYWFVLLQPGKDPDNLPKVAVTF